ncbi:MAG: carbamoyl-phosphate synthase large subunit [Candidatus Micrarchaeota archaeon]|nr:carbamoyl-phosphate synthase large subunit [Candidatus Micrarchaeota archaeon]
MKSKVKKVLVIGSGPIVIGQAAEFDYSGTQACNALREEGIEVVLVNSNPATIQTDKEIADKIYIEPLTVEVLEKIIAREKPEGILATVGGQTALNLASELHEQGILDKYGVKFLGTDAVAIKRAEAREEFNNIMRSIGIPILPGVTVNNFEDAHSFAEKIHYPVIVRPSFTLGGSGSGVAKDKEELRQILDLALRLSATHEALIEKSVSGWGEFEYEVIRDSFGNSAIICTMENIDPMGIHTGESIVVAPVQTLSDNDHQKLRSAALKIVEAIGVQGSCNVQYAVNQSTGDFTVIEVNPRLSRSSALASKATGYPIARVATKIALGQKLHEIKNSITGTSAAFEPALDYCVVKIPRWPFDKFPQSDRHIGTQMKSTGEVMAIGRTFEEALQKAMRSLEVKIPKFIPEEQLNPATDLRLFAILELFRKGVTIQHIHEMTKINLWFLQKIFNIIKLEKKIFSQPLNREIIREAKRAGFSDKQIGLLKNIDEKELRILRKSYGIIPTYKIVDSCAGEFDAITPYYYSTYETENEAKPLEGRKVIVLGSGPIRIGQGIEFDYCCSHASFALRELGINSIVINNNPETVSTDFDSSDRLYFEPLTSEDVLNIIENEQGGVIGIGTFEGVIVQFGGQTSINLAPKLHDYGVKILGTQLDGIDIAEDRERFRDLLHKLGIPQPANGTAINEAQALAVANKITYPVVVRPSYVIAGRGMQIVYDDQEMKQYIEEAVDLSEQRPVLIDKYIDNAYECEVDAISDGKDLFLGGLMEHIEFAGVHSGDANIVLPSLHLDEGTKNTLIDYTDKIARSLDNIGMINLQYVVKNNVVYVLEANPRASRTVPFVSKAIGIPLAKIATKVLLGHKLKEFDLTNRQNNFAVKSVVFPFLKLVGSDIRLGPEMRSTGETMGIGSTFEMAYYKALLAAGVKIKPVKSGTVTALLSLREEDKVYLDSLSALLRSLDIEIYGTPGTATLVKGAKSVPKIGKGDKTNLDVLETIKSGGISLVINTPRKGGKPNTDGFRIRRACIEKGIPCITNVQTAFELLKAMVELKKKELEVKDIAEYWK